MNTQFTPEPKGIGGWLLLFAFGLITAPGRIMKNVHTAKESFSTPEMMSLIERSSEEYNKGWATLYLCEVPLFSVLIFISFALLPFFFLKQRCFPIVFALFTAIQISINTLAAILSLVVPGIDPEYQNMIILQGTVGSAAAIAWATYLFRSKRARNTFTKSIAYSPFPPFFRTYEKGADAHRSQDKD